MQLNFEFRIICIAFYVFVFIIFCKFYIHWQITNYCTWRLTDPTYKLKKGTSTEEPSNVGPSTTEAIFTKQTDIGSRTEGLVFWELLSDKYCLIFWRVEGNQEAKRDPNMLAVGCRTDRSEIEAIADGIMSIGEDEAKDNLVYKYFCASQSTTVQHCDDDLCIQGIMPASDQITVKVDVFPRKLEHWADYSKSYVSQAQINDMVLPDHDTSGDGVCHSENPLDMGLIIGLCIGAFVIVLICCCCCCFLCCCK